MNNIRVYDFKLFVNSVMIPQRYVKSFDINEQLVPNLSTCNISLVNEDNTFIYKDTTSGNKINCDLIKRANKKGHILHKDHPIFQDNDLVVLFIKVDSLWQWGFFGYITTCQYNSSVSQRDVIESISLIVESSLKPLRYSYYSYNSLFVPAAFREQQMQQYFQEEKMAFAGIGMQGLTIWQQIHKIFTGKEDGITIEGGSDIQTGEGNFVLGYLTLSSPSSVSTDIDRTLNASYQIGSLQNLNSIITRMQNEGWGYVSNDNPELDFRYPRRNVYIVKIANADFENIIRNIAFSAIQVSQAEGKSKADLLLDCIKPWYYVAYTLPSGDVVIEPNMAGSLASLSIITEEDDTGYSYSMDGKYIKTVALTLPDVVSTINAAPGVSLFDTSKLMTTVATLLPYNEIRNYGLRTVKRDMFPGKISRDMAENMNQLILTLAWSSVHTAKLSANYDYDSKHINRGIYSLKRGALYLIQSMQMHMENKYLSVTYNGGYGKLTSSNGSLDSGYTVNGKSYSILDFLFNFATIFWTVQGTQTVSFNKNTNQFEVSGPVLEITTPGISDSGLNVSPVQITSNRIGFGIDTTLSFEDYTTK